jgi:hypothetical protein
VKASDIRIGCIYSNPTEKYGGLRIVDVFIKRLDGTTAVRWTSALKSSGHDSGVSTLQTFARWARSQEPMSEQQISAHRIRARQHAVDEAKYGREVRNFLIATSS